MNYEYSYLQDRLNSILSKNDLTRVSLCVRIVVSEVTMNV